MDQALQEKTHQVVIVGSGPAGLTAAIYAARADLEPLVLEGSQPGGQLTITTDVENFPGFPEGIMGPDVIDLMRKQAQRFGATCLNETVKHADLARRPFKLEIESGGSVTTKALIIATGASAKLLGLDSERKLMGYGVSACATCDGFFFRDKHVAVIGGGDTAMEEAGFLTKFASKVTVLHRREELRASKIMQQRAFDNPKIEFKWNVVVEEMLGTDENKLRALKLRNRETGESEEFVVDGCFLAIGHNPNTRFVADQLKTRSGGFIEVDEPTTYTSVEGVFACGDVIDSSYRQAITAAGTGCRAAIDAERWLESQNHH